MIFSHFRSLKWYYNENRIFPVEVLKHKQVACMRSKMLLTTLKYLQKMMSCTQPNFVQL